MKPHVLILRTAGTNCDKETEFAFKHAGARTSLQHINRVKKTARLSGYQIIALPGGFSYGDDLGAGKIFSLEISLWLKDAIKKFIDNGGLMIGICNGFQIMVKTGLLPDADFIQRVTLTDNDSGRFEDRWVYLKIEDRKSKIEDKKPEDIWLKGLPEVIMLPVAHGEGKFYASRDILDRIEAGGQAVLKYCDAHGNDAAYPLNPNGALNAIAGITDSSGRIFGLMPHPERFMFKHHSPFWQEKESEPFGVRIFKNAIEYFK